MVPFPAAGRTLGVKMLLVAVIAVLVAPGPSHALPIIGEIVFGNPWAETITSSTSSLVSKDRVLVASVTATRDNVGFHVGETRHVLVEGYHHEVCKRLKAT